MSTSFGIMDVLTLKFVTRKFRVQSLDEVSTCRLSETSDTSTDNESDEQEKSSEDSEDVTLPKIGFALPSTAFLIPTTESITVERKLPNFFENLTGSPNSFHESIASDMKFRKTFMPMTISGSGVFERLDDSDFSKGEFDAKCTECDFPSSEEELSPINWQVVTLTDSGSHSNRSPSLLDEEVCDLFYKSGTSTTATASQDSFNFVNRVAQLTNQCSAISSSTDGSIMTAFRGGTSKKRCSDAAFVPAADRHETVIKRPSLDFEKMQKTCYRRRHIQNGIHKQRAVRIQNLKGSMAEHSSGQIFDPSAYAFRSLSLKHGLS